MRTVSRICFFLMAFSIFSSVAQAIPLIDQNQSNTPVLMASFSQPNLAQSFKQVHDNIAGAGIFMHAGRGVSDVVTLALWDNLPGHVDATMLASGSDVATSGAFFDVFWNPIEITPGQTYFLVFTSQNNTLGVSGDTGNPYPDGIVYANLGFSSFGPYDYAFRTYYESGHIPEPVDLALLGVGLLGAVVGSRYAKRRFARLSL